MEAGIIQSKATSEIAQRLNKIYQAVLKLISDSCADCLILEKIYADYKHPATACALGQARGVICLAAATKEIPVIEYTATRVKKAVTGKGMATKIQVQRMVMHLLKLTCTPEYLDVTDALALAIAHSYIKQVKI